MTDSWARGILALRLLALDPVGLGGAVIRMRASPLRDQLLGGFQPAAPIRKIPVGCSDAELFGGVDFGATLAQGTLVRTKGLLATDCTPVLAMAERCAPDRAARLAQWLDARGGGLLCIDEGVEDAEVTPRTLSERLAFHIAPDGRAPSVEQVQPRDIPAAAAITPDQIETLTTLAAQFGIDSLRAPLFAVAAAKAHARLNGRGQVIREDLDAAAALVYPHRATQMPEGPEEETQDPAPSEAQQDQPTGGETDDLTLPDEMMIEAIKALLPDGLLDAMKSGRAQAKGGAGAGQAKKGNRRGRPLPSRAGRLDGRARIDLVATLRAAAPWQKLRQASPGKIAIRPSDIRLRRYEERSDRLLIFTVDASGSSAMARLGEAKGAVELLLGDAYARRDHVALIAFRGESADVLLPPTRSLVQTKRRLAALPGGGGTPLAAALQSAQMLAGQSSARGLAPNLILLTDGRANIALDGRPDRAAAQSDATTWAAALRAHGLPGLVIDTGKRPSRPLQDLSGTWGSQYLAMPRASAETLQAAVTTALPA